MLKGVVWSNELFEQWLLQRAHDRCRSYYLTGHLGAEAKAQQFDDLHVFFVITPAHPHVLRPSMWAASNGSQWRHRRHAAEHSIEPDH